MDLPKQPDYGSTASDSQAEVTRKGSRAKAGQAPQTRSQSQRYSAAEEVFGSQSLQRAAGKPALRDEASSETVEVSTVAIEPQPELGDDDFELWEQEVDYKIDYQDLQLVGTAEAKDSTEMEHYHSFATQKTYTGEAKPLTESLDVLSILPRGISSVFQLAVREMEASGEPVVPLEASVDGLKHVGLPLDDVVGKIINVQLQELREYWADPETDITHFPLSDGC